MKKYIFKIIITIWNILPAKRQLASLINKNPTLKSKLYKDLRYKGKMKIDIDQEQFNIYNPGFTTIENELFWNGLGGWEKVSVGIWKKLTPHSNCILDIGANTGIYSLIAATLNPNATVIAFEPVKRTLELTKKNIELNPNLNILLVEKAVSNVSGISKFYDLPTDSQYSASLNEDMLRKYDNMISYDVETIQLDKFEELNNKPIDLIKLDIEMHEPEAIKGMINLLKKYEPTILIEVLTPEIGEKIDFLLKDINYLCFSIDEENEPKRIPKIKQSDFHNILLIKENKLKLLKQND